MPRNGLAMKALAGALLVVSLFIAGALAWTASELHYGNCLDAAQARHPDALINPIEQEITVPKEARKARKDRIAAVRGCSRVP